MQICPGNGATEGAQQDPESGYESDNESEFASSPFEPHCHLRRSSVMSETQMAPSRGKSVTFASEEITATPPHRPEAAIACRSDAGASEQGNIASTVSRLFDSRNGWVEAELYRTQDAGKNDPAAEDDNNQFQKIGNHQEHEIQDKQSIPDTGIHNSEQPTSHCFSPSSYANLVHELQSHIVYLELQNEAAEAKHERLAAALIKGSRMFNWVTERRSELVQSALNPSRHRVDRKAALASLTDAIEEQNSQLEGLVWGKSNYHQMTPDSLQNPFEPGYEGMSEDITKYSGMTLQDSNIGLAPVLSSDDDPSDNAIHQLMAQNVGLKHQVEVLIADKERLESERREETTKQNSEINSLTALLVATERENHELRELLKKQDAERKWLEAELRCESDRRSRLEQDAALLVSKRLKKLAREYSY